MIGFLNTLVGIRANFLKKKKTSAKGTQAWLTKYIKYCNAVMSSQVQFLLSSFLYLKNIHATNRLSSS